MMARRLEVSRATIHKVVDTLHQEVFDDLLSFIDDSEPNFWGQFREDDFVEQNLYLALYHDITGLGYKHIIADEHLRGILNHKSLQHNTEEIRRLGAQWAKQYIELPSYEARVELAKHTHQSRVLGTIDLWADSTDFPMVKKRNVTKKHRDWSYKENKPAQRFMCFTTGDGIIRKLYGGYSPKVYDGQFLEIFQPIWEEEFAQSKIIADEHFRKAGKQFKKVTWVVPFKNTSRNDPEDEGRRVSVLTQAEQKWNSEVSKIRSRIEAPFGHVKRMFNLLSTPWMERKSQQNWLVTLAVGVHNKQKL